MQRLLLGKEQGRGAAGVHHEDLNPPALQSILVKGTAGGTGRRAGKVTKHIKSDQKK